MLMMKMKMMRTNMDVIHMVQVFVLWAICLIGLSAGEYAVGKFGILMPQVKPYRVSVPIEQCSAFFYGVIDV